MASHDRAVFIDGCAVDRFALINVHPVAALRGSGFAIAITPALEAEYRRALDHLFVPPYVKTMIADLLDRSERRDDLGAGSTDRSLVALASAHVVITDDAKLYRRLAGGHPGLLAWPDVEAHLRAEGSLADLVRARAAHLPAASA